MPEPTSALGVVKTSEAKDRMSEKSALGRDIIVIATSEGGIAVLRTIVEAFPGIFRALFSSSSISAGSRAGCRQYWKRRADCRPATRATVCPSHMGGSISRRPITI